MSDREYYRDYSRPPRGGRDPHHRYYDDEYVVVDHQHHHARGSNDNVSARRGASSRPRAMSMYDTPQRPPNDYDIEVVYDDEDSVVDREQRRSSRSPPPRRPASARRSIVDVPPPPLGLVPTPAPSPPGHQAYSVRDDEKDREWEREREVVIDVIEERHHRSSPASHHRSSPASQHRASPADRARHNVSTMVHPPASVHPSHAAAGAVISRHQSPASGGGGGASVYEYGDRPTSAGRARDEYAYTRDDGVVVVRSQPQEIEIIEQIVPVARSGSRARSKSRVRRKASLDMRGADSPPPYKRLIVACDGTWLNSDNGMANGELAVPSNVTRISRAIKPMSKDRIPQIVYYQFGVGSRGNVVNRVISGSTGGGLEENVREAYSFLSNNYTPGDEIFLIGFSRGAFTARSIAGLIDNIGHRRDRHYKDRNPDIPFSNKPNAGDLAYRYELEARGMTTLGVRVKAIGVWDTVGSLGAPRIGWLTRVGLQPMQSKEMTFYDTKLSNCVDYAFQALALDERRTSFAPALWEKSRDNKRTVLRQVWFPGVHSNVGGGYDDQQLANITLAWMVAQLQPFLDFKTKYVFDQELANDRFYSKRRQPIRPWSFGEIPNSSSGIYSLAGSTKRTPGQYTVTDPHTGRSTGRPLRETCEYMHASVRTRLRMGGPGTEDKGRYDPEALDDWRLVVEYPPDEHSDHHHHGGGGRPSGGPPPEIFWRLRSGIDDQRVPVTTRVLPEAPLSRLERDILAERDPESFEYVMWPPRTKQRRVGGGGGGSSGRARSKSKGPHKRERMSMIDPREREVVREDVVKERRRRSAVLPPEDDYRRSMPERLG
ncbi:protein of unknown function DUF2235 [Lasiodiplodia theobromae]|nr:protein of unknown function DUF2235 [Lasiodiplodia theobromae]